MKKFNLVCNIIIGVLLTIIAVCVVLMHFGITKIGTKVNTDTEEIQYHVVEDNEPRTLQYDVVFEDERTLL